MNKEWEKNPLLLFGGSMKKEVSLLINDSIKDFDVFVDDVFKSSEEGKTILNIVLDSEDVIDLNRITEASRVINKILDKEKSLLEDIDELDIYSKEKGEDENA